MGGDLMFSNFDGGQMGAQQNNFTKLLSIDDVCEMLQCSKDFIYSRTGKKPRNKPVIPSVKNMGSLRFHPEVIEQLFFQVPELENSRSLKIEETRKTLAIGKTNSKRVKEKLW